LELKIGPVKTVAVFDTEPVAIEGLRSLLQQETDLEVAASGTSLLDGYESIRELQPSITLLDKAFGLHAIMDFLKMLRSPEIQTATVIWGPSFTEAETLRLLQLGSSGIIRKTAPLPTIVRCLRTVLSGSSWLEDGVFTDSDWAIRPQRSTLTARELEVVELVERGMKNRDIAEALGIRTGTVKIHLKHIFEKTGIRGRYGLALSGLREKGLVASS
jgi:two-component system nitrate/nitrite response regulator NarL